MNRAKIIAKLDKAWALKIREKGFCEKCGKTGLLNAHHYYSRSFQCLRWNLDNGFCLCVGCHTFGTHSAHKAPADFCEWAVAYRGEDWQDNLREIKAENKRLSNIELEEKLKELTQ